MVIDLGAAQTTAIIAGFTYLTTKDEEWKRIGSELKQGAREKGKKYSDMLRNALTKGKK